MCSRRLDCLLNFSPTEGVTIAPREGLVHGVVPVLSRFPGLVAEGRLPRRPQRPDVRGREHGRRGAPRDCSAPSARTARAVVGCGDCFAEGALFVRGLDEEPGPTPSTLVFVRPSGAGVACPSTTSRDRAWNGWGCPARWPTGYAAGQRRTPQPREPGDEWPHGRFRVPAAAQDRLEALERHSTDTAQAGHCYRSAAEP